MSKSVLIDIKHKDKKIWLHTGDIGYIAPNGIVYYTSRLKRMIVSSGFNVYPGQIEHGIMILPKEYESKLGENIVDF